MKRTKSYNCGASQYCLCLLLSFVGFAGATDIENSIHAKVDRFAKMCARPKIDSTDLTSENLSTDGGVVAVRRCPAVNLTRFRVELYGESYQAQTRIYTDGSLPIFVIDTMVLYNVPYYIDSAKAEELNSEVFDMEKADKTVTQAYFQTGRMISAIEKGRRIERRQERFTELEKRFLGTLKDVQDVLQKKKAAPQE